MIIGLWKLHLLHEHGPTNFLPVDKILSKSCCILFGLGGCFYFILFFFMKYIRERCDLCNALFNISVALQQRHILVRLNHNNCLRGIFLWLALLCLIKPTILPPSVSLTHLHALLADLPGSSQRAPSVGARRTWPVHLQQ